MMRSLFIGTGQWRRSSAIIGSCVFVGVIAAGLVFAMPAKSQAPKNDTRKAIRDRSASAPPTAEEAAAFLADAEARLLDLGVKASHANWVQENFITEDTEQIAADANQNLNALSVDLAKKAKRFDGLRSEERRVGKECSS